MIGDKAKEIIASTSKDVCVSRTYPLSLSADYIHEVECIKRQSGAYFSNFQYTIRYAPASTFKKHDGRPYLIKIDFFDTIQKEAHRFESYEAFCNDEKFGFTVSFLTKYTRFSQWLFDLAKNNPYCDIPICFDIKKYIDDVLEKYKEEHDGEEIKDFTFLSETGLLINACIYEDKVLEKTKRKNHKIKGVVDK